MRKAIKIIFTSFLFLFSFLMIIGGASEKEIAAIIVGIVFGLIGIKVSGLLSKGKSNIASGKPNENNRKESLEIEQYLEYVNLMLESGLSMPAKTMCKLTYFEDKLTIEGSGVTYNLPTDRLIDIDIKSTTEIETFYNSSIGGAVGGAIILGPLGAMIGGRNKTKKIRNTERFLVITYDKDNEVNFIVFNADDNLLKAHKFEKIFRKSGIKHEKVIDL